MPGRTSTRTTRAARPAAATTRKSGRGRTSASNVEIPEEGPETSLRKEVVQIFSDAQKTLATQRKLQTLLRKIQERCCFEQPQSKKKKAQEEEEEDFSAQEFNEEVTRCLVRVLNVKKGVQEADRIIKFLGLFLKSASEKDRVIYQLDADDVTGLGETPTSQLIDHIIETLLKILFPDNANPASNKIVHFRATQALAHIIGNLAVLDDRLFALVRAAFKKLTRHKEPTVRVQAVLGLSCLMSVDDEESDDEDDDVASNIMEKLLDMMQNDPSAEVRRTIVNNMEYSKESMRYIFERARDIDPSVRRIVYRKVLPSVGDFRFMKLAEREKLLRWGLRDRDDLVRKAAGHVFYMKWLEDCASSYDTRPDEEKKPGEPAPPSLEAVRELLERIDLVGLSGGEEGIAHDAMQLFWENRTDYYAVKFSKKPPTEAYSLMPTDPSEHDFWRELDPQYAFFARSLSDYCTSLKDIRLKEELELKIPDSMPLAKIIMIHTNALLDTIQNSNNTNLPEDDTQMRLLDEDIDDKEFVVLQLLHIALSLDYSDTPGRNAMLGIIRDALNRAEFPEECTKLAIQVLRCCCSSEAEFCSLILEAIAEIRDTLAPDDTTITGEEADEEESFHSAQSDVDSDAGEAKSNKAKAPKEVDPKAEEQRRVQEISVYLKCLHIAQCTLQNVYTINFSNASLAGLLNTLIIPAVRGQEAMIRELGLECLALCSILSKDLADSNIDLFFHCFAKGHDALKEIAIQAVVDIIWQHRDLLVDKSEEEGAEPTPSRHVKAITKAVQKGLKSESHNISLIACTAASKLLLFDLLPEENTKVILRDFILAYFDPETAQHPGMRQALSYFLPTFSHSKLKNATLMAQIAVPVVTKLLQKKEDVDEEDDEMVGWPIITAHLADWTDGRKVVGQIQVGLDGKASTTLEAQEPHICLANEILEYTLSRGCSRDEREPLLTVLTKVYIAPSGRASDEEALSTLQRLVSEAVESKLGINATQRNYLAKLDVNLTKRIGELETVDQAVEDAAGSDAETATPEAEATEAPETAPAEEEGAEEEGAEEEGAEEEGAEEEDTMMAGMQAESTRMPLGLEDDEDVEMGDGDEGGETPRPVTEDDIVNSLLASEIDDYEEGEEEEEIKPTRRARR